MFDTYVFDTTILSKAIHPDILFEKWINSLEFDNITIVVPEIADYELRRELLRANKQKSIKRLNEFQNNYFYLPLDTEMMRLAAELWAQARNQGYPTATNDSLDGDVILAAQTLQLINDNYQAVIITENVDHLKRYTNAEHWKNL